jgi:CDP-glycerol glycerophosphotransferase (TagB/SpsB family)
LDSINLDLKNKNMPVVLKNSLMGLWFILRAEYLVIEQEISDVGFSYQVFGKFKVVQTWHGTPLKKIGLDIIVNKKFCLMDKISEFGLKKQFGFFEKDAL